MTFATAESRDYYVFKDPEHNEIIMLFHPHLDDVIVLDFENDKY
jgi:hypothetical protein